MWDERTKAQISSTRFFNIHDPQLTTRIQHGIFDLYCFTSPSSSSHTHGGSQGWGTDGNAIFQDVEGWSGEIGVWIDCGQLFGIDGRRIRVWETVGELFDSPPSSIYIPPDLGTNQHLPSHYIVDFFIPTIELYVELFGVVNQVDYTEKSRRKIKLYEELGLKVLALNHFDLHNLDESLGSPIRKRLNSLTLSTATSTLLNAWKDVRIIRECFGSLKLRTNGFWINFQWMKYLLDETLQSFKTPLSIRNIIKARCEWGWSPMTKSHRA